METEDTSDDITEDVEVASQGEAPIGGASSGSAQLSPPPRAGKGGGMPSGLATIMGSGGVAMGERVSQSAAGQSTAVTVGDLFDDDDDDEGEGGEGGGAANEGGRQSKASLSGGAHASAARLSACASAAILNDRDWEYVLEGIFHVQPGTGGSQRSLRGGGFSQQSALTASRISLVTGRQFIPNAVMGTGSLDEQLWAQAGTSASTPMLLTPVRMAAIQRGSRMRTHLPTSNEMTAGIDVGPLKVGAPPPKASRRLSVELAAIQLRILTEYPAVEHEHKQAIVSALLLTQRQAFARQLQAWREETAAFYRALDGEMQRAETKLYLIKSMQDPAGALLPAEGTQDGKVAGNSVDPGQLAQLRAFLELRAPPRPQFSPLLSYRLLLPIVKQALAEQRTRDIDRSSDEADALAASRRSAAGGAPRGGGEAPPAASADATSQHGPVVNTAGTVRFESSPMNGASLMSDRGTPSVSIASATHSSKGGSSPSGGGLTELQRSQSAARSRMLRARRRKASAESPRAGKGRASGGGPIGGAAAATLLALMERASKVHQTASTAVRRSQAAALEESARAAAASPAPQ